MSGTATHTQIWLPSENVAFTDRNGLLTREWRYVLLALVQRTGGSGGGQPTTNTLQQQINDLSVLVGADAVPPPDAPAPLADPLAALIGLVPTDAAAAANVFDALTMPPADPVIFDNAVLLAQAIAVPE